MQLNKNHYAALISVLILLNILVFAYAINIHKVKKEENYFIEMTMEVPEVKETPSPEAKTPTKVTHRAVNQQLKTKRSAADTYQTLEEFMKANANEPAETTPTTNTHKEYLAADSGMEQLKAAAEKRKKAREALKNNVNPDAILQQNQSNRSATITYSLKNRITRNEIPNPIYTCEAGGKVVISIKVDSYGNVTAVQHNESASSTSNTCLVANALQYAKRAKFNANPQKNMQIGTITYFFQGK